MAEVRNEVVEDTRIRRIQQNLRTFALATYIAPLLEGKSKKDRDLRYTIALSLTIESSIIQLPTRILKLEENEFDQLFGDGIANEDSIANENDVVEEELIDDTIVETKLLNLERFIQEGFRLDTLAIDRVR